MNNGPLLFLGIFLATTLSFWGMILTPHVQLGRQDLREIPNVRDLYPFGRLGSAKDGAEVYRAQGCVECHTQQVRPEGFGSDIERGWGIRRTVALDYLRDEPVQLGHLRLGPDLANAGLRQPTLDWQLKHLYHPKSVVTNSIMPPYAFLFTRQPIHGRPSPDALKLEGEFAPEEGFEIVPTAEAKALAAYLVSLRADIALFEAPLPPEPVDTNAAPAAPAAPINPEDFE